MNVTNDREPDIDLIAEQHADKEQNEKDWTEKEKETIERQAWEEKEKELMQEDFRLY